MAILEFLEGNTAHPSAEDIFREVRGRYPAISFATVYNTLEALKRAGGVRELTIDAARRRYDPDTGAHHHLICGNCGKIVDVHARYRLAVPHNVPGAFEVTGNHVEFYGTCGVCKELKGGRSDGSHQS